MNNIYSSAVVCPICGGPTHINRDTGDFTCDHCGKIIVRSSRSSWVPSMFDAPTIASFDVEASLSPDVKAIMHDCELRGFEKLNNANYAMYRWPHMPDNWTNPDNAEVPEDFSPIIKLTKSTHPSPAAIRNAKAKIELLETLFPHPDGPWDPDTKSRPNSAESRRRKKELDKQKEQDASYPEAVQRAQQSGQAAQQRIDQMRQENDAPVIDTSINNKKEEKDQKPNEIKPVIPVMSEERIPPPSNATKEEFAEYNRKRIMLMSNGGKQDLMDEGRVGDIVPGFRDYSKENQEKYCATATGILKHTSKNGVPRCDYCRIFDYYRNRTARPNLTDRMYGKVKKAFDNVLSETPETARNKPAYGRIMAIIKSKTQAADNPDGTTNITTSMSMGEVRPVFSYNNYIDSWF